MANVVVAEGTGGKYSLYFKELTDAEATATGASSTAKFQSGKWGKKGEKYIDGYVSLYYGPKDGPADAAHLEQNVIAIQDKMTGRFLAASGFDVKMTQSVHVRDKFLQYPAKLGPQDDAGNVIGGEGEVKGLGTAGVMVLEITGVPDGMQVYAFGRYNSESDFEGNYLGEVEIRMDEYTFRPSSTSIGVSWSQLTEIVLDTSFGVSAEETLVSYASQEIRSALDYRAIRLAYAVAKTNTQKNPGYFYTFDAAWNKDASATTLEGYIANAQTFTSALDAIGDTMFNEINRGGVSRLVGGPSACSYLRLNSGYSTKGIMNAIGPHQFGELDAKPVFKVPHDIIPTDEILTAWKNDQVENDVSIAFGTLVPFFSTGIIQRKNLYKEAGLATYGDWAVLNRRYLALIKIANMKDSTELRK